MEMDIYYSYACRDSYLVYAWLKLVQKSGQALEINWHPFAIQMDDPNEYWSHPWTIANSELRGFIAAEAARRQGSEAFLRFHDALESAVHEQLLELGEESTLIAVTQQAGLDTNRFQADWQDPQLARAAQRSHLQAVEQWNISGTPTLVFPNGNSYHLELSEVPDEAHALETFRAVEMLTVTHPYISQLRRTN
jgi:predicted DsbA family dithiol-disulfide isomerase